MTLDETILVIGSGTFGISTAYHLASRGYTNITCIDKHPYPSPDSAGYDLNKIIRTEYDEPLYAKMALEALKAWRAPFYKDVFHETGWLVTTCGDKDASAHLQRSYENLKKNDEISGIDFVETPEDLIRYVPQLKNARDISNWKGLWNKQAGWAHAHDALKLVADEAKRLGVKFVSGPDGTMTGLEVSEGKLTGIKVASGNTATASQYILCTGAASPALLPELSTHLWSKCWTLAHIELTEAEVQEYRNMPVVDNHELGFFFEPDPITRWLKICNATQGYQSKTAVDADGLPYSIPRYASDNPEDGIPEEAEKAIKDFIDAVLPQFAGRPLLGARICWCTDTADQHFLISRHDKFPNLLLGTGDSGHGFKFLPTIGSYIADALAGNERGLRSEWQLRQREWKKDLTRPGDVVKDLRDVGFAEERPSCARCLDDGRPCEYLLRLIWPDESSRRGVKHGRGKHADVSFVDPTPSMAVVQDAGWGPYRVYIRHFLNTVQDDVDETHMRSIARFDQFYRRSLQPRLLYTPRMVDLSTADGTLFQYYQAQVCHTLTIVDDASNYYRQTVLSLSVEYECVMRAVLAVGALYLSANSSSDSNEYYSLALHHKQRTLNQLRFDIASLDGTSSNHILVAMLLLCLFDITDNCQTSWPTHVAAASNLITKGNKGSLEPSLVAFVSKFFTTRDVMGRSACGQRAKFREIAWEHPQEVDYTMGCSSELLMIISSINDVSRLMAQNQEDDKESLTARVIALETQLENLVQLLPGSELPDAAALVLVQTSSLVHNAAKIYLFTVLHAAQPSTHLIRQLVTQQVQLLKEMTSLRSAHLWSIFVTALYASEDEERIFFLERFELLKAAPATRGSTQAAQAVVETVWKKRDLDMVSDHPLERELSDWVVYVRPISDGLSLA
ncbi:fructosyl amine:oxygen oxidoreductase [Phlyctema vagabunda]|uniref:Fructosyl amine:oxygen oxidoreductase n=1 Tax=Phlyctema vagabunda TaxID=108571 RepID=A0ABR4PF30_9HELO